jgi:hypothetical protein
VRKARDAKHARSGDASGEGERQARVEEHGGKEALRGGVAARQALEAEEVKAEDGEKGEQLRIGRRKGNVQIP